MLLCVDFNYEGGYVLMLLCGDFNYEGDVMQ